MDCGSSAALRTFKWPAPEPHSRQLSVLFAVHFRRRFSARRYSYGAEPSLLPKSRKKVPARRSCGKLGT